MLEGYPTLISITALLDEYLKSKHGLFFGDKAQHPFLELKPYKDIHDPIWGATSAVYGGAMHPTAQGYAAMADAALPSARRLLGLPTPQ